MAEEAKPVVKKKIKRVVPVAVVHITAGYNNTLLTIADPEGGALTWSSSGSSGFKGSRKSTPYAAQVAAENAATAAKAYGVEKVSVILRGVGPGREQAIRGLHLAGLDITSIVDRTPIPHNGCRKKNPRKV